MPADAALSALGLLAWLYSLCDANLLGARAQGAYHLSDEWPLAFLLEARAPQWLAVLLLSVPLSSIVDGATSSERPRPLEALKWLGASVWRHASWFSAPAAHAHAAATTLLVVLAAYCVPRDGGALVFLVAHLLLPARHACARGASPAAMATSWLLLALGVCLATLEAQASLAALATALAAISHLHDATGARLEARGAAPSALLGAIYLGGLLHAVSLPPLASPLPGGRLEPGGPREWLRLITATWAVRCLYSDRAHQSSTRLAAVELRSICAIGAGIAVAHERSELAGLPAAATAALLCVHCGLVISGRGPHGNDRTKRRHTRLADER